MMEIKQFMLNRVEAHPYTHNSSFLSHTGGLLSTTSGAHGGGGSVEPRDGGEELINPQSACAAKVTVVILCLCICVSVFCILPSRAFRHPTRGICGYSVGNAVNLKGIFSKTT